MKRKLLFAALVATSALGMRAQTDVTSTYLTNPGFETDGSKDATTTPTGWTLASSSGGYTSYRPINATSTPNGSKSVSNGSATGAAEGSCYLYLRTNWGSGVIDLTQTTSTTLPVGHYVLKADILQPYTTTGMPTFTLSAKNGSTSLASVSVTNDAPTWKTFSVEFDLSESTSVTVDLYHATGTGNGDGCLSLVDNIRLIQYNYTTLQTLITEAEELYDEAGTGASTFNSAITTAKAITSTDATATVTAAIEALEDAIDTYKAAQFVAPDDTDYSSWITNYTLDTNEGGTVFASQGTLWGSQIPSGWTIARNTSGAYNTKTVDSGKSGKGFETWSNNSSAFMTLYQSISSLPAGQYTLAAYMQNGGKIFVQNGDNEPVYSSECSGDSWTQYSVSFIKESADDVILIGTVPSALSGSAWGQFDEFSLTCNGIDLSLLKAQIASLQAEAVAYLADADYTNVTGTERTELTTQSTATAASNTVTAYNTLQFNVQNAIDAFIAAVTNYDALAAEITKATALGIDASSYAATSSTTAATALTNTQSLKVAEYNYVNTTYAYSVELGAWTTTGPTGSLSDQHYKGSGYSYLEQSTSAWSSGSWTIKYAQDLTLPAGDYVFKVAGRQANDDGVTLSLTVKNGETTLGTVSDFPKGDTGLGINTSGATDFTTGEGHTYANGGAGRGWEWRYVKFTLAEEATVNVAVDAVATTSHMWVSFCDATVQTDNAANVSLITYNVALTSAQTILANDTYANVTGSEKTALQEAIDADDDLDKTSSTAIDAATAALNSAASAFTAAVTSYDALVTAITTATTLTTTAANVGSGAFQIPTSAKTTLETATATASATKSSDETTAATAATAAATLNDAVTAYTSTTLNVPDESDAYSLYLADGGSYAKTVTFKDGNASAGTYAIGLTEDAGSFYNQAIYFKSTATADEYNLYILDADGTKHYLCTGTVYSGNNNQLRMTTDDSKALAVKIVASTTEDGAYNLQNSASSYALIGTSDGGFYTVTKYNKFNINAATVVSVPVAVSAEKYATRIFPFVPSTIDGITYYSCDAVSDDKVTLTEVDEEDLAANTPYILYSSKAVDTTLSGYGVAKAESYTTGLLTGVYTAATISAGNNYVLQTQDEIQAFYVVDAAFTATAYRAYLTAPTSAKPRAFFFGDDASGIATISALTSDSIETIYTVSGAKVNSLKKGINIIKMQNGEVKKVLVK